jgi:NAD(P)-dependent dehydrogenase (short-subunit alcohol dehydrogenase family)
MSDALPDPFAAFRLDRRTALVTGARREIGRAIALALGAAGARVAVHHVGTAEEAGDAAEVVARLHGSALPGPAGSAAFAADFSAPGAGGRLAADVLAAFGRVDILVLNASVEIVEPFGQISDAAWERQIAVNLRATLDLLQALVPAMAERGWGRVLTIGSVQEESPAPTMFVYAGSKAMQHTWGLALVRQYGRQGVTVNNLAPGAIATARNRDQLAKPEVREWLLGRIPTGRFGTPEDLAGAALLLCSDAGAYINGAHLHADGGRMLG